MFENKSEISRQDFSFKKFVESQYSSSGRKKTYAFKTIAALCEQLKMRPKMRETAIMTFFTENA